MFTEYKEIIEAMRRVAGTHKVKSYIVGGIVRDALLGLPSYDLDFTIEGDAIATAHAFAKALGVHITVHDQFLTAKVGPVIVAGKKQYIDIVTARSERYGFPGKLPQVTPGTIKDDLLRRDFTINALAIPVEALADTTLQNLPSKVLDVTGGLADLDSKLVRILHPGSFFDDPTRMYRACRYAGRMGMQFEAATAGLLAEASASGCINSVSHFRRFAELEKFCEEADSAAVFKLAFQYGLIHQLGWYSKVDDDKVRPAISYAASVNAELRYAVVLRVLAYFALPADRAVRLQGLQKGKVFVKEILFDIEAVQSGRSVSKISDAGVMFALAIGNEGGFKKEAQTRGLV